MACSMASTAAATSEDDFLRVLEEMNRLCGDEDQEAAAAATAAEDDEDNNNNQEDLKSALSSKKFQVEEEDHEEEEINTRASNLEDIFSPSLESASERTISSSVAPLIGDQLLSSVVASTSKMGRRTASVTNLNPASSCLSNSSRSRHDSANSGKSCVSFDSAIGDIYSVQTPTNNKKPSSKPNNANGTNNELDIFDLSSTSTSSSPTTLGTNTTAATSSVGQQFDNLAASVCFDSDLLEFDTSKDVDGLGGISLRLVGSEDVDLVGTSFSLAMNESPTAAASAPLPQPSSALKRSNSEVINVDLCQRSKRPKFSSASTVTNSPPIVSQNNNSSSVIVKSKPPTMLTPQLMHERQEVERICLDLLRRFQHACALHPKTQAKVWMAKSAGEDPLLITTRLISDSLARLRIFVHSLDPMNWLMWHDRHILYRHNVCILSVFKAAVSVNLEAVPMAYPLPYGEYLGEVEALHLIMAHDLYNELRALLSHIQSLGIREFPVMLLVMMIAFFSPQPGLKQPDKVVRINDYYMHKLQVYLHLRFGPEALVSLVAKILSTIERVRSFSQRFREFLDDVTRSGLQRQFESVCENIGLIAFLLQTEPKYDQC